MPPRGPTLNFDPYYVDIVVSAWQKCGFVAISRGELQQLATEQAEHVFIELTMMGLAEQHVKSSAIKSAVTLLKSLKLVEQMSSGPKNAKSVQIVTTTLGRPVLEEDPATGNIRVGFVGLLVKQSPLLDALLRSLENNGPLSRPVVNPVPGTPRKGAMFNRKVLEGLSEYESRTSAAIDVAVRSAAKQTATQKLKEAAKLATLRHPAGTLASLEKLLALAADLGLIWRDVEQVNQALGIESFGLATVSEGDAFIPNVPKWSEVKIGFADSLLRAYVKRVDSSGFATVEALRGSIGRELRLSAAVVDAFLCLARELGDHGEFPLLLQYEPNDDLLYAAGRRPLVWQETAFDFVEVRRALDASSIPSKLPEGHMIGVLPS